MFACTGITKAVSVRVTVDVAEATLAVDVEVVMPAAPPVFTSPVAEPISLVGRFVGEIAMLAPYPVLSGPLVGKMTPAPEAAQSPKPDVALVKVLLHVRVLPPYACSLELGSLANAVVVIQTVGAAVVLEKEPFCAESATGRAGAGPPRVKVTVDMSVGKVLRS